MLKQKLPFMILLIITGLFCAFSPPGESYKCQTVTRQNQIEVDFNYELRNSLAPADILLKAVIKTPEVSYSNPVWIWKENGVEIGRGDELVIPIAMENFEITLILYDEEKEISRVTKSIRL